MSKNTVDYQRLYKLTCNITPLDSDCGELCGRICCLPGKQNNLGIYLYPGEEKMYTGKEDWLQWEKRDPKKDDFPGSWSYPLYFIYCTSTCPRKQRPLNCRFFPLAPHLLLDGTLLLIYESFALPYTCPLIQEKAVLRKDFIEVAAHCWYELLKDRRIRDLVQTDSRERESEGHCPHIVWWGSVK